MKLVLFFAAVVAVASASNNTWWSPPSGPVCVSDWWPYTCAEHNGNEESVCVGWDRYDTIEQCTGVASAGFTGPEGPVCVSQWWPFQCDFHNGSESSVCVGWDRYDTLQDCGVTTAGDSGVIDGWCVTSWWDPFACDRVSSGNCIGWFPAPGGYETEQQCLGGVEQDDEGCSFNCGDFCVTQWWPLRCGNASGGCAGWTRYETIEDCCPDSNPNCGEDYVKPSPGPLGWCVESWTPTTTCTLISSGNCLPGAWYPGSEWLGDGRGWETQDECEGRTKSAADIPEFKQQVNVWRQIDALKTMEVLKLNADWAAETTKRELKKAAKKGQ